MKASNLLFACALAIAGAPYTQLTAQVQTIVPDAVPGAKPVRSSTSRFTARRLRAISKATRSIAMSSSSSLPAMQKDKKRRYPVVYALHGYSIGAEQWTHEIHVPQTIEGAFAQGAQEMIVVLPDSKTVYNGSMYSSSATTGDFERLHLRTMSSLTSTRTIAPFPIARAAASSATPWAATARRALA